MRNHIVIAAALAAACTAAATAQSRVMVLASGDSDLDTTVVNTLTAQGLVPTVGPAFHEFTSAVNLASTDVVYFQCNNNWTSPDMPLDGQQHLLDFVTAGGGLVTTEWVLWRHGGSYFNIIGAAFPATTNGSFTGAPTVNFSILIPHLVMTGGLPPQFEIPLTSYSGTESELLPAPGATVFLTTSTWLPSAAAAVIGSNWGTGRVVCFSTVNGPAQFDSAPFRRLLANTMRWADALPSNCYPDCNGDGAMNLADFGCFQTKFALGDLYSDCNGDTVLNLADFGCFQTKFAFGCP